MKRILMLAALTVACHNQTHVDNPSTTAAPVGPARTQAEPVWSPSPTTTNQQMPFNPTR